MSKDNRFNAVIAHQFTPEGGETRTIYTPVGTAVPHKTGDGYTVYLRQGIAVSGELLLFPRKEEADTAGGSDDNSF